MYRRKLNKILLVVAGLLFVVYGSYAQDPASATRDYTTLNTYKLNSAPLSDVCPSSVDTFRVEAVIDDTGDTWFEWIVYGGSITSANGVDNPSNEAYGSQSVEDTTYFYIPSDNYDNNTKPKYSEIEVTWDSHEVTEAWVAVLQKSQWGCSDTVWSVVTQRIFNTLPQIDFAPTDIQIAYTDRQNFTLPLPTVIDNDACTTLSFSYEVRHNGTTISSEVDVSTPPEVNLEVGVDSVIWTITDGAKQVVTDYAITVDPLPLITNVAWTTPLCAGNTDASLYISGVLEYPFPFSMQFQIEGGSSFTDEQYYTGLWAGDTTLQAKIDYYVDKNYDNDTDDDGEHTEQYSPVYTVNIPNPLNDVINDADIPGESSEYVDVTNTGCLNTNDGAISVNTSNMNGLKNSVYFDGVDDYMLLNKSYDIALSQFSVAAWVKMPETPQRGTLISFDADDYFQVDITYNAGVAGVRLHSSSIPGVVFTNNEVPLNDGQWHLLVAAFDNGEHRLYIDGVKSTANSTTTSVGEAGTERFGMIGAKTNNLDIFIDAPQPEFFKGYIAEMAVWDTYPLTDDDVSDIRKQGISNIGNSPDDWWLFNNVPENVSGTNPHDTVFTDLGNRLTETNWARFFNGPVRSDNNNPLLYTWSDEYGNTAADFPAGTDIEDLPGGGYTLHVHDITACLKETATYNVGNDDEEGPELYWNVALRKSVADYTGTGWKLTDGDADTRVDPEYTHFRINLGNRYNIKKVVLHGGNNPLVDYTITLTNTDVITSAVASQERTPSPDGDTVSFSVAAQYVWLQPLTGSLSDIAEVEVFVSDAVQPRLFYLSSALNSCYYPINTNDLGIYPFAYDACTPIVPLTYTTYNTHSELTDNTSLTGGQFYLGADTVYWTATDDISMTDELTIPFVVLDTVKPYFYNNHPPISLMEDTLTYCNLRDDVGGDKFLRLPIPQVLDNYMNCASGEPFKSINLKMNGSTTYRYTDDNSMGDYNYTDTDFIDITISSSPGYAGYDYTFVWVINDFSNNVLTDTLRMRIEAQPQVRNISLSPNRCNESENQVIFNDIQAEKDRTVTYFLRNTDSGGTSYNNETGVFTNIETGTYEAFIEVNGCRSNNYYQDIVVEPSFQYNFSNHTIDPVLCAGYTDGSISMGSDAYLGGSQTSILHFMGNETGVGASVPNYEALELTTQGTIEGWVYLDTLGDGSTGNDNYNVGLFGVRNGSTDGYGFRMVDGNLRFYVGSNYVETAVSDTVWYHVAGRWTESSIYLDVNSQYGSISESETLDNSAFYISGGLLYMGSDGETGSEIMRGFVRAVRIWDVPLTDVQLQQNRYLNTAIDAGNNRVADLIIDDGTNTLYNQVGSAPQGTVQAANTAWQKFAYYWSFENNFVERTKDIDNQAGGYYKLTLHDPLGCTADTTIFLYLEDVNPPKMFFSNVGYNQEPFLVDGGIIWRYTNADGGGAAIPTNTVTIQENTTGFCEISNGSIDDDQYGYTGTGFANTHNSNGEYIEWEIWGAAGEYTFTFRYANGSTSDRPGNLIVEGTNLGNISLPNIGGWTSWNTALATHTLSTEGFKTIRLQATTRDGLANIDYIEVEGPGVIAAACDGSTTPPSYGGDCTYTPTEQEFNPVIDDGVCDANEVDVTMEILRGGNLPDGTLATGLTSLDGVAFSDSITIRWTATDLAGLSSQQDVTYYVVDNEAPTLSLSGDGFTGHPVEPAAPDSFVIRVEADENCAYVIGDGEFVPHVIDNCDGLFYNTYNSSDNLNGIVLYPGTNYEYEWHYYDTNFSEIADATEGGNSDHIKYTIVVEDYEPPTLELNETSDFSPVYLDENGLNELHYTDVMDMNFTGDNCTMDQYIMATNVAYRKKATARDVLDGLEYENEAGGAAGLANDGGYSQFYGDNSLFHSDNCGHSDCSGCPYPWWEVDLGGQYRIYRIVVYLRATSEHFELRTNNFYTLVSDYNSEYDPLTNPVAFGPEPSANNPDYTDWREGDFVFPENVVYRSFVPGESTKDIYTYDDNGDGDQMIPPEGVVGRHVRVWNGNNNLSACLQIAEVEVYGAPVGNTESLTLTCFDVRPESLTPDEQRKGMRTYNNLFTRVIDGVGNYVTGDLTQFQVLDKIPPVMSTKVITVNLNGEGYVDLNDYVEQIDNGTWDACGIDEFWVVPNRFECGLTEAQEVTFWARDNNGNVNSQKTQINILDETPPVVEIYDYIQLELNELGYYVIDPENDLVQSVTDNCGGTFTYDVEPDTVYCHQAGQYIDLTLSVTDENSNTTVVDIEAENSTALVLDLLPPTAVTGNYTLTIDEDGEEAVAFDDIIDENSIYDNCGGDIQMAIKYNGSYTNWCPSGQEGLEESADDFFTNIAGLALVDANAEYSGTYNEDNVNDGSLGTRYISASSTGPVEISYDFGNTYEITGTGVVWHEQNFITETALSHNAAYRHDVDLYEEKQYLDNNFPLSNIYDGDPATYYKTNKFILSMNDIYIEYEFSETMVLTRTELMWFTNGTDYGDITKPVEYPTISYSTDGNTWTEIGDIGTSNFEYNTLDCGGVQARYVRLNFSQQDYCFTGLREWYVYGYPLSMRDCKLPSSATVDYYNGTWHTFGLGSIGTAASPTVNEINTAKVEASQMRITVNTGDDGHIGIKEWYVYGREACREAGSTNINLRDENGTQVEGENIIDIDNVKDNSTSTRATSDGSNTGYVQYNFSSSFELSSSDVDWYSSAGNSYNVDADDIFTNSSTSSSNIVARCNDNRTSENNNSYVLYNTSVTNNVYVEYRFDSPKKINSSHIYWSDSWSYDVPPSIQFQYYDENNNWVPLQTVNNGNENSYFYSLSSNPVTSRVRIIFDLNGSGSNWWNYRSARIREWYVNVSEPYVYPNSATLDYYDGSTWTQAATLNPVSGDWNASLSGITARSLRLSFSTDAGSLIAINNWSVYGVAAGSDNCIPCTNYTCNDVYNEVPVWLQYTDESGNSASTQVMVPVIPYFEISEVQIKECGYSGQRYYPVLENFTPNANTFYEWTEVDDGPSNIALFQYPGDDYRDYAPYYDQGGDGSPENIADGDLPYIRDYPTNWAYLRADDTQVPAGTYEIELTVTDENGCWDSLTTAFDADAEGSAVAVKEMDVCLDEEKMFRVSFPSEETSFWRYSTRTIDWTYDSEVTYNNYGNGYDSLSVTFNNPNEGNPIDVSYNFSGQQLNPDDATIHPGDGTTVTCTPTEPCQLIVGQSGSTYWLGDDITTNHVFAAGEQYLVGNGSWTDGACAENLIYRVSVLDVPEPELYVYDQYNSNAWVLASDYTVCPMDTLWYRVENHVNRSYEYDRFSWNLYNISGSDTISTGTILAQGNATDDSILVRWDKFPHTPQINVSAIKRKADKPQEYCSQSHTYTGAFEDTEAPTLDCSDMDVEVNNTAGICFARLTNAQLDVPDMYDDCRNRIASFYNTYTGDANAEGVYPVGETQVGWAAFDYSGKQSEICYYTVNVVDNEAPNFSNIPGDLTGLSADDDDCVHTFVGTSLDVTANDNCPSRNAHLWVRASVYSMVEVAGIYERDALLEDSLASLEGFEFPIGRSELVWYAHDSLDNDNNGTFENIDSISIIIGVTDRTAPELHLPDITVTDTDDGADCAEFVTISDPAPTDNCTAAGNITWDYERRTDGRARTEAFDVGQTGVIFSATDQANNTRIDTLVVTVLDEIDPWVEPDDPFIQDVELGYCNKSNFRMGIPDFKDNCTVWSFTWRIFDGSDDLVQEQTVSRDENTELDPNANGYVAVDELAATEDNGGDYYAVWQFEDVNGNVSEDYTFDIRIQILPLIGDLQVTQMTCGNAKNGTIVVSEDPNDGFRAEPDADIEYAINGNWTNPQVNNNVFSGLGEGEYEIRMRVNGCYTEIKSATIEPSETYSLALDKTDPYCYEDSTGTIDVTMTGGVDGQVLFYNSTLTANYYPGLDSMSTGAGGSGEGTIEAWIFANDVTESATIVSKGSQYSLGINIGADTSFVFTLGGVSLEQNLEFFTKRWYYIAATWDETTMRIYVDNVLFAERTGTFGFTRTNTGVVEVGNHFDGIIREVRLWNTELSGTFYQGKLSGAESHLQAYWPLITGSGTQEDNKVSAGTPLIGITAAQWRDNLLQPGVYKWYKDEAFFTKDSVNMTGLKIGEYRLEFTDLYGCPENGLKDSVMLDATDNVKPVIENIPTQLVYTGENNCEYVVASSDTDLWPDITDDCHYAVTWQVVPLLNPIAQIFTGEKGNDSKFAGAKLELGTNTVTVNVTQNNGRVSAQRVYQIEVLDTIKPEARITSIAEATLNNVNNPMGSAYIEYDAYELNDNTEDNCTPQVQMYYSVSKDISVAEPVFSNTARFDCSHVGDEVQVAFMATDASENDSIVPGARVTVSDDNPPEFTGTTIIEKRLCATQSDPADISPDWAIIPVGELTLPESEYTDNCAVRGIRYKFDYLGYGSTVITDSYNNHAPFTGWSEDNWQSLTGFTGEKQFYFDDDAGGTNKFYEGVTEIWFRLYDGYNDTDGEIENNVRVVYRIFVLPRPDLDGHDIE